MAAITIESAFIEAWNKNTEEHPAWGMKSPGKSAFLIE